MKMTDERQRRVAISRITEMAPLHGRGLCATIDGRVIDTDVVNDRVFPRGDYFQQIGNADRIDLLSQNPSIYMASTLISDTSNVSETSVRENISPEVGRHIPISEQATRPQSRSAVRAMLKVYFKSPPIIIEPRKLEYFPYGPILSGGMRVVVMANSPISVYVMTPEQASVVEQSGKITEWHRSFKDNNIYDERITLPFSGMWVVMFVNESYEKSVALNFEVGY